ncbi:MAG: ABC transporter ATP-binding protein/permease, partial [Trueperella sp.]
PGERLAIVGPSGAGKSTLGRLIAAVNPPDAGSIRVGGVEVTSLPEALLHRTIALVTQENHVFVGTIADNLRFAKEDATDDELLAALATVDATWVERLDNGLETLVGSGERELAPSQAQQLALARIVLLDPDVLILDEATSLLDPTVARSAEQALVRLLEGRTVISIAHRLYTAYDADRVAVMIDGEVAELGSHDDLVALGGEYASLWEAWQQD